MVQEHGALCCTADLALRSRFNRRLSSRGNSKLVRACPEGTQCSRPEDFSLEVTNCTIPWVLL